VSQSPSTGHTSEYTPLHPLIPPPITSFCPTPALRLPCLLHPHDLLGPFLVQRATPADLRTCSISLLECRLPTLLDLAATPELHHFRPSAPPPLPLLDHVHFAHPTFRTIMHHEIQGHFLSSPPLPHPSPPCHPRIYRHLHTTLRVPHANYPAPRVVNALHVLVRSAAVPRASQMGQGMGRVERCLGRDERRAMDYIFAPCVTRIGINFQRAAGVRSSRSLSYNTGEQDMLIYS
jgi:hypothetical protein